MSTIPETPKALCPCSDCKRPMRPRGVLLKEMPGTMAWGHSGKCKSCIQPHGPGDRPEPKPVVTVEAEPPVQEYTGSNVEHNRVALNSYLAGRERRLQIQAAKDGSLLDSRGNRLPVHALVGAPVRRAA